MPSLASPCRSGMEPARPERFIGESIAPELPWASAQRGAAGETVSEGVVEEFPALPCLWLHFETPINRTPTMKTRTIIFPI
ncbi:hypothetical protein Gmet_2625 [Geobacter metallireducens GS-15]|uniref:Uncharacterized protein n=1 Tax=Geobacter metallireducens (strain ATCC 53774 / DSM 7210 / GS-15) TaxID=269799 RepID=Q39SD0_GEOMG|nr:hypothetical protein Gmet_2625 [Geobacter metallireducens GS-15]